MKIAMFAAVLCSLFVSAYLAASETFIEAASAKRNSNGSYHISVTLKHADKSWDHYANVWQVQSLAGEVLATRVLHHPHINEQPFTRSLSGVKLPEHVKVVEIVAGCTVDGLNSQKLTLRLD